MTKLLLIPLTAALLAAVGCAGSGPRTATAEIMDAKGELIGTAHFEAVSEGVKVTVKVSNLSPGPHGIHIHEVAKCEPPDFSSAGPHFDPNNYHRGQERSHGHHAGDLPNLMVEPDGTGHLDATLREATLSPGHHSLFFRGGSSIVIHSEPDDMKTDPGGESGDRIACGVIVK